MVNDSTKREVVIIPMMHTGSPKYYNRVKKIVDSLRSDGFVFFYESVQYCNDTLSAETRDTLDRKLRKVVGFHLTAYNDKENESLPFTTHMGQVEQTWERTGLMHGDIHADLCIEELVRRYEAAKGEIVLTDYDLRTGLTEKYYISREEQEHYNSFYIIHKLREDYLLSLFDSSSYPKVAVLYGAGHKWFIIAGLDKLGFGIAKYPCKK